MQECSVPVARDILMRALAVEENGRQTNPVTGFKSFKALNYKNS